ncbi:MAG: phospho-sugar mutase [Nitriliruptorales bacterium]|nr:phospho-sugar mutase [Nitriliruptorales bacterium]
MPTAAADDLHARARDWIAGDPDPQTRAALEEVLAAGDDELLADLVDGSLEFGTAGLRGVVGPGPRRMNRAVVIRTTRGLADHVLANSDGQPLAVVGRDARTMSDEFARDAIGVLAAAGFEVRAFADPVPTPLVAYAAKRLGAATAIVVTASHNPPEYNGYKVYAANGAQIIPPEDAEIAAAIDAVGPASGVARAQRPWQLPNVAAVSGEVVDSYLAEVDEVRPAVDGAPLTIVHTALHGVAGDLAVRALQRAGRDTVRPVAAQADPDPGFPTIDFPNPEEPGALDLALAAADEVGADLVLANDPDGDRLAVAVPAGDAWTTLTGNQIGALLGTHLLEAYDGDARPLVVSSIVSSPMLAEIAAHHGASYEATLTGFKWICNAALAIAADGDVEFVFGYEEALGFTVGDVVRDKDGVSAAVLFADLVSGLRAEGRTVRDRLDELYRAHGLWVSVQHAVTLPGDEGQQQIDAAMQQVGEEQPESLAGRAVVEVTDFREDPDTRPWWLPATPLVRLMLEDGSRVLVRPSGTEPKLKIYADLRRDLDGETDVTGAEDSLRSDAERAAAGLASYLGIG